MTGGDKLGDENPDGSLLDEIGAKVDSCMQQYQPYMRQDFNLNQLSVISNIPEPILTLYFAQPATQSFNQYIDEWRVRYAKMLMSTGKVKGLSIKTIGSLSGFSSTRKFIETFIRLEGISPELFQSL
jgi:AraC-like DNA-binding protein